MLRVDYRVHSQSHIDVQVDGTAHRAGIHAWDEGHIRFALDDVQRTCALVAQHGTYYVHSVLGSSELCEVPRFPPPAREEIRGGCRAPMPGKILAVRVTPGQAVNTGDTLVILEAMKMEHEVVAPHRATVQQVCVEDGQQVDADAVLVILEEIKDE